MRSDFFSHTRQATGCDPKRNKCPVRSVGAGRPWLRLRGGILVDCDVPGMTYDPLGPATDSGYESFNVNPSGVVRGLLGRKISVSEEHLQSSKDGMKTENIRTKTTKRKE